MPELLTKAPKKLTACSQTSRSTMFMSVSLNNLTFKETSQQSDRSSTFLNKPSRLMLHCFVIFDGFFSVGCEKSGLKVSTGIHNSFLQLNEEQHLKLSMKNVYLWAFIFFVNICSSLPAGCQTFLKFLSRHQHGVSQFQNLDDIHWYLNLHIRHFYLHLLWCTYHAKDSNTTVLNPAGLTWQWYL